LYGIQPLMALEQTFAPSKPEGRKVAFHRTQVRKGFIAIIYHKQKGNLQCKTDVQKIQLSVLSWFAVVP